jgi:hypothetical protein
LAERERFELPLRLEIECCSCRTGPSTAQMQTWRRVSSPAPGSRIVLQHIPPRADIASGRRHCPMSSPRRFPPPGRQHAGLVGQVLTKTSTIYFADKTPSHFRNLRKCSARPRSQRLLGRFNEQGSAVHHLCARRNGCYSAIRGISTRGPIRGTSRDAAIRPTSHRPIWSASRRVLIAPIDR